MNATTNIRPLKALAILAALVLIAPCSEALAQLIGASHESDLPSRDPPPAIDAGQLVNLSDPYSGLERIELAADAGQAVLPDAFVEEVGLLEHARDVRASEGGMGGSGGTGGSGGLVVGYTVDLEAGAAFECLERRMRSLGWSAVPLGQENGATFVKRDGRCTWALATCSPVGPATSVVIRCVIS